MKKAILFIAISIYGLHLSKAKAEEMKLSRGLFKSNFVSTVLNSDQCDQTHFAAIASILPANAMIVKKIFQDLKWR